MDAGLVCGRTSYNLSLSSGVSVSLIYHTVVYLITFPFHRLCRVQNRIFKGFEVFEYYANNVWSFDNSEAVKLRKLMNNRERKTYVIEKIDLDLIDYFTNCVLCARRLILKESDESIPAARRHMKMFVLL